MNTEAKNITLKDGRTALIRMARESDAASLAVQAKQVAGESRNLCGTPEEHNFSVEQEKEWIKSQLQPGSALIVADVEGRIVGCCNLHPQGGRQRVRHRCGIGISVLKEFWGNKLGTYMLEAVVSAAQNYDYEQMELEVISTNEAAIHLYEKMGFVKWGLLPHAFKYEDGTYGDFCTMILDLRK